MGRLCAVIFKSSSKHVTTLKGFKFLTDDQCVKCLCVRRPQTLSCKKYILLLHQSHISHVTSADIHVFYNNPEHLRLWCIAFCFGLVFLCCGADVVNVGWLYVLLPTTVSFLVVVFGFKRDFVVAMLRLAAETNWHLIQFYFNTDKFNSINSPLAQWSMMKNLLYELHSLVVSVHLPETLEFSQFPLLILLIVLFMNIVT